MNDNTITIEVYTARFSVGEEEFEENVVGRDVGEVNSLIKTKHPTAHVYSVFHTRTLNLNRSQILSAINSQES